MVSGAEFEPQEGTRFPKVVDRTIRQKRQERLFRRKEVRSGYTDYEFISYPSHWRSGGNAMGPRGLIAVCLIRRPVMVSLYDSSARQ